MKRPACIAIILCLAAAAHAQDLPPVHKMKVVAPPKRPVIVLRGAQSGPLGPQASRPQASRTPALLAAGRAYGAPPSDPAACRTACARSYYFCLAGGDADSCPSDWTSCRARCENPSFAAP